MRTIYAVMLGVLLLVVSGCGQKVNEPADVQALKAAVQVFVDGYNSRDANAICSLMADDVAFAVSNIPAITGKEALKKLLEGTFKQLEQFNIEFSASAADVQVHGDLGVARGTYARKISHKTGLAASEKDSGSWTAVYRRQSDGSWKCISDMGTSDQLLPGTTADGADEKALIQIEHDFAAAMLKADTAALDRVLAKEYVFNNEGQVQSKAQFLGDIKTAYKLTSGAIKDLSPRVFGNFAIVSMAAEMKGTYKGKDISGSMQSVDFFVRRDGRWQAVYTQNTAIKP